MIFEREENGFFEKVITIHPLTTANQKLEFNRSHVIYEFDLKKYFYPRKSNWYLIFFLPIRFLIVIKKLRDIIKKENIQVIRATDHYLMGLIALFLARLTKLPFCISIHSDYEKRFTLNNQIGFKQVIRTGAKWIPKFVLKKANLVLPIRECYVDHLIKQGVRRERVRIIPHGIAMNFQPQENIRSRLNIPNNKQIISFVGRLAKDNYIDDMLNVLEILSQNRNDFVLVIVGNGELEPYILEWLQKHPRAKSKTCYLGFQSYQVARSIRYISAISLCLMGGFSLIEAGAAGCPIIAYDVEWHYELVENNVTGFLVDEKDIAALVQKIFYLLDNPEQRKIMGKNSKRKILQRHDILKTTQLKQNCYLELLNEARLS